MRPSTVHASNNVDGLTRSFQPSASAMSVMSRNRPASINSSAWRPWLNWNAPIGSPPVKRLTMTARAASPPAIAASTHLWPVASNAFANSFTAAASPPDVHQCMTSRSVALAALALTMAVAQSSDLIAFMFSSQKLNRYRCNCNVLDFSCKTFSARLLISLGMR